MKLKIGDLIPNISLKAQDGGMINFRTVETPFVVYFYPKDFTPGCTTEACSFRDSYEDFKDLGAEVYGVSSDSSKSHSKFSAKHQLPFVLLSDPDKKARRAFGVKPRMWGLVPGRETFVFDKEGKLIFRFNSLNGSSHTSEALEALKKNLQQ